MKLQDSADVAMIDHCLSMLSETITACSRGVNKPASSQLAAVIIPLEMFSLHVFCQERTEKRENSNGRS